MLYKSAQVFFTPYDISHFIVRFLVEIYLRIESVILYYTIRLVLFDFLGSKYFGMFSHWLA